MCAEWCDLALRYDNALEGLAGLATDIHFDDIGVHSYLFSTDNMACLPGRHCNSDAAAVL